MNCQVIQSHHHNPVSEASQILYFAYGSNLSFDQMAKRCPDSCFLGRARLYRHAFQINQRGFANVVETRDPGDFVDGLCYRLSTNDELSLDRSEGVPTAYQKKELEVEFFPAAPDFVGRDVVDIVHSRMSLFSPSALDTGVPGFRADDQEHQFTLHSSNLQFQPSSASQSERRSNNLQAHTCSATAGLEYSTYINQRSPTKLRRSSSMSSLHARTVVNRGATITAMVYLSKVYVNPSRPWDEYIERMKRGLQEALQQGISTVYVNEIVQRWLRIGKGVRMATGELSFSKKHEISAKSKNASFSEPTSA